MVQEARADGFAERLAVRLEPREHEGIHWRLAPVDDLLVLQRVHTAATGPVIRLRTPAKLIAVRLKHLLLLKAVHAGSFLFLVCYHESAVHAVHWSVALGLLLLFLGASSAAKHFTSVKLRLWWLLGCRDVLSVAWYVV